MSTAVGAPAKKRRCLYEILEVPLDATSEQIRSSYRKLALKLHPDKVASQSPSTSSAEATAVFQDLVHAYEVLSDVKERKYYDSHRNKIVFSDFNDDPSSKKSPSVFHDLDIFSFFSSSAFSGFSDSGKGFYKVYSDVFYRIFETEMWFCKQMNLAPHLFPEIPPMMGNLESPYAQVTAFYGYWSGFVSIMDFNWADLYDPRGGYSRKERRAMEELNKKARKKAKREHNESVRGLAAFAKKRDKRVIDMGIKREEEEKKRKEAENERKKELEMKKAEKARLYQEQEWAKIAVDEVEESSCDDDDFNNIQKKNKKKTNGVSDTNCGGAGEELYCVACHKKFKSNKQWKNHEQSKKHRDNVAELRDAMLDDYKNVEEDSGDGCNDEVKSEDGFKEEVEGLCERFEEGLGSDEGKQETNPNEVEEEEEDETYILEAMLSGHKDTRQDADNSPQPSSTNSFLNESDKEEFDNKRKGSKNKPRRRAAAAKAKPNNDDRGGEEAYCQVKEDNDSKNVDVVVAKDEEVVAKGKDDYEIEKIQKTKIRPKGNVAKKSAKGKKQKVIYFLLVLLGFICLSFIPCSFNS